MFTLVMVPIAACAADGSAGDAWALLGTGETTFEAVGDGDDAVLVAGNQGGWHVWVGVRTSGLGARARLEVRIEPEGWDGPSQVTARWVALDSVPGEPERVYVGFPAVLSYAPCFVDRLARITLSVEDERGRSASDELILVPRAPTEPALGACTWEP